MSENTEIIVDGILIPIGQTMRGGPARQALPDMLALSGLRHFDRIEPAGILSVSTGMHPPRIAAAGLVGAEGRP